MSKNTKALINFLAEIGQLKRVKRSGWWVAGIKDPESVAEHCLRTAIIGYIIARMEKVEPYQVILTILFHDTHEARTNDLHKISLNYFDFRSAEKKIIKEQLNALHATLRQEISALLKEYHAQKSKQAIIARDADILECILQAKEYLGQGYTQAKNFLSVGKKHLKTKSAQQLFKSILTWNYQDWWLHLAKFSR